MLGTDILRSSAQGSAPGYTRCRVLHRASPLATSCLTILELHRPSARPALAGGLDQLGVKPGAGWPNIRWELENRMKFGQPADKTTRSPRRHELPDNAGFPDRSEEHTSELQSLMRNSYAVFCLKKKKKNTS